MFVSIIVTDDCTLGKFISLPYLTELRFGILSFQQGHCNYQGNRNVVLDNSFVNACWNWRSNYLKLLMCYNFHPTVFWYLFILDINMNILLLWPTHQKDEESVFVFLLLHQSTKLLFILSSVYKYVFVIIYLIEPTCSQLCFFQFFFNL